MKRMERYAIKAGVDKYMDASASEIMVLGEDNFDKLAKLIGDEGKGYHGYRTGAWEEEDREYWWMFQLGNHPNPAMAELVSNNMD